jgi:hypothetical protein
VIVFLDIDGVLNSTAWADQRPLRGFIPPVTAADAFAEERIDPAAVARTRRLVEQSGASIVLISSWRHRMPAMEFARLLALYGWADAPVIGATPDIPHGTRGDEVDAWLAMHGWGGPYVCIDDDQDFAPDQPHIQTNPDVGLTDADVSRSLMLARTQRERDIWARVAMCAINREREGAALETVIAARSVAKTLPIVGVQELTCTATGAIARMRDNIDIAAAALLERIERHRPLLERLAFGTDYARVCSICGLAISQLAGCVEQSPLGHMHSPDECDVCGRIGSVSPSGDYRGEGDDAPL